ncbi:MAG: 4Fe-4S dicluster domain-containing protein [Bryobacteraceae bacterium]
MADAMVVEPDVELIASVMAAGGADLKKCMQCSTCTCVCSLSTQEDGFPRRQILHAQWGLKDKLLADVGPWLCHYCGECSQSCPRQANPGEAMMALRRYLTAQYDWTGLSRLMYRWEGWNIIALLVVALVVVALFTLPHNFGFGLLSQSGPAALSTVMLDKFAPKEIVHIGDTALALLLGLLVLGNAARMFLAATRGGGIPLRFYLRQLPGLIVQGLTQKRWTECRSGDSIKNWVRHLVLVSGYATIFILVVVFLPWFQVQDHSFHWSSLLGYYASAVLLGATAWMIADRIGKRGEMHSFSQFSDWLFPALLFVTVLTRVLLNIFRLLDRPMPTYVLYVVHLAVAVPMLAVEVPFGKWAHLLYRPLAIYIAAVKRSALESR